MTSVSTNDTKIKQQKKESKVYYFLYLFGIFVVCDKLISRSLYKPRHDVGASTLMSTDGHSVRTFRRYRTSNQGFRGNAPNAGIAKGAAYHPLPPAAQAKKKLYSHCKG